MVVREWSRVANHWIDFVNERGSEKIKFFVTRRHIGMPACRPIWQPQLATNSILYKPNELLFGRLSIGSQIGASNSCCLPWWSSCCCSCCSSSVRRPINLRIINMIGLWFSWPRYIIIRCSITTCSSNQTMVLQLFWWFDQKESKRFVLFDALILAIKSTRTQRGFKMDGQ